MQRDPVTVTDRKSDATEVALLAGARMAAAAMSAVTTLLVARSLSKTEFGYFAVVTGVVGVLVVLADLGLTSSMARYLADGRVDRRLFLGTAALRAALASMAGIGLLALSFVGDQPHDLAVTTRLASVLLVTNSTVALANGLLPTLRRIKAWAMLMLLQPAVELAGVALVLRADFGAPSAVVVLVVASVPTALISLVILWKRTPQSSSAVALSGLVRYALPLFGVWGCVSAFGILDQALITALKDAATAAPYALSWKLVAMIHIPAAVAAAVIAPRLVQSPDTARQTFTRWLELLAVVYLGIATVAAALSTEVFPLIGTQYRHDGATFRSLSVYILLLGVGPLVSVTCNFLGAAPQRLRIAARTIGLNLALDLLLIPRFGVHGAAISTTIAYLWYVVDHLRLARSLLGDRAHPPLRSCLPRVAMAAGLSAVLGRLGVSALETPGWIGVGLCAALAFASYLLVTLPVLRTIWARDQ
jgi:O-antigen/teichoic acid export membrane protein